MCSLEQWGSKIRTWEVRLEYEKRIREGRDSHHFGKSCIEFQTNIHHTKSEISQSKLAQNLRD